MFYTYILKSELNKKYYIGQTNNLKGRLNKHNKGGSKWTKPFRPWELAHYEEYNTRSEAIKRENYLKSLKDKPLIDKIISQGGGVANRIRL